MIFGKEQLMHAAGRAGAYYVSRRITAATPKILMYHRFSNSEKKEYMPATVFARQIQYLTANFNVMTMRDLILQYNKNGRYPRDAVVITVDDGYSDFYEIAYPILKDSGASATFFITTRFVDGDYWLWPDKVSYVIDHVDDAESLRMPDVDIGSIKDFCAGNMTRLKSFLNKHLLSIREEDKNKWITSFAEINRIIIPDSPIDEYKSVSWCNINELENNGIEIGAHTRTHVSLGRVDIQTMKNEIQGSIEDIEMHTGKLPVSFCYPNGQPQDINESAKEIIRKTSCLSAVTAYYDADVTEDRFEIRRFHASSVWREFMRAANGVHVLSARLLNRNNIMY